MIRVFMLFAIVLLVGCASNVKVTDDAAPAKQKSSLFTTAADITLDGEESIKGEKRVIVPFFRVGFYVEKDAGGTGGGGLSHGTAHTSIDSTMTGVDAQHFQQIVDSAYVDFIDRMQTAGFEVIDFKTIAAQPAFAKLDIKPNPHTEKALFGQDAVYVAPSGTHLTLPPQVAGISSAFSGGRPDLVGVEVMKGLNASLVDVTYYIDYLSTSTEGKGMFSTRVSVEIGQGIYVLPGSGITFHGLEASKCVGYCPNMVAYVKLGQTQYSNEPVGELVDLTTGTGEAVQKAANVLTGLLTGSVREHREFELKADPAKYVDVASRTLMQTNEQLISKLAANR